LSNKISNIGFKILRLPIIRSIVRFLKKYSLPGFSGVPIWDVMAFIYKEAMKDDLVTRANSIAFSFFLALFPALIFLFTLLPLLPFTANYLELLDTSLKGMLPDNAHNYLFGIIQDVASIKRSGLLSIGFFFALFFSSSGVVTLMSGFDKTYDITFKKRSYIKTRVVAVLLTALLSTLLICSLIFIILGKPILGSAIHQLHLDDYGSIVLYAIRWFFVIMFIYLGITIIYHYAPSMYKKISFWNVGSVLACGLSIASSVAFAYFINNFGRYNELYGSIGALIVIMLWLQINAFILLVGFELNASIAVNRDLREHERFKLLDLD